MIRVDEAVGNNWYRFSYANNFSLSQWVNNLTDLDFKRSLKTIMDKTYCPIIFPDEKEQLEAFDLSSFELIVDNTSVPAIGSAFLLDMPVVSFLSMPHWYESPILVRHDYIDGESDSIQQKTCEVENISQLANLESLLVKLQAERQASKTYLKELVQFDNDDYPDLIFCTNVLDAFKYMGISNKLLSKIIDVLSCLNQVINTASSTTEIIETLSLTISGESDSTKNNSKLIKYRKFKLPDGRFFTFDLHVKNFPESQRLYFHPDFLHKNIYIGHFGKHLPI